MLTNFERLAKSSRKVAERVHGASVTIYPVARQGGPNGPLRLSQTVAPYDTSVLFFEDSMIEKDANVQPRTGEGKLMHRSARRQASIRVIDGMPLQTDFILKRTADGALFTITQFDPDGVGNVMATLAVAGALPEA